ncbi:MAG: MFS transporter [Proteobacteria bacterium]|nr:MFS transporter [Pseudomonadota bacterium]
MSRIQIQDIDQRSRSRSYRWLIFLILSGCYILVNFHRLCPAVLAIDLMKDLEASGTLTGFLSSAYFYSYAIMQLPAGLLADSWGPRKTITLFFIIASLGSLILGMSSSVALAITGRALVGLGVAMVFVPTMKILTKWFHVKEFAFMVSLFIAMGGVGTLTAATPLVWLNALIGWRNAFLVVGAMTFALALCVWFCVRNSPADFGWPAPYKTMPEEVSPDRTLLKNAKIVLSTLHFWPLALWFFCNVGIFFAIGGLWGGPYLEHVYHLGKSETGQILSTMAMGLVIGSPLFSILSDRVFHRRKAVMVISSALVIVIMGIFSVFTDGLPLPILYLLFFLFSVFSNSVVSIGFTLNKELFPVSISGTATGLINLFPFAGGAFFQPLVGHILESYGRTDGMFTLAGYKAVFHLLLAASGIAFTASLFLKETMSGKLNKAAYPQ